MLRVLINHSMTINALKVRRHKKHPICYNSQNRRTYGSSRDPRADKQRHTACNMIMETLAIRVLGIGSKGSKEASHVRI